MNLVDQINGHKYLYLDKLQELSDLELEIWISEARVAEAEPGEPPENTSAYGAIITDNTCKSYKIYIKGYVAYCVTNESCGLMGEGEEFTGNLFRHYSKSKFLDFAKDSMSFEYLEEVVEKKANHIEIVCLNHIIDIICFDDFSVEEL
jgi:hypothetical protein